MSTYMAKAEAINRKWYILDAAGKPMGRTAATAAEEFAGRSDLCETCCHRKEGKARTGADVREGSGYADVVDDERQRDQRVDEVLADDFCRLCDGGEVEFLRVVDEGVCDEIQAAYGGRVGQLIVDAAVVDGLRLFGVQRGEGFVGEIRHGVFSGKPF